MITGGEDLATAMGAQPTPEFLHLPKLLVHLAAKAEGLCSLGLLHNISDFKDTTAYTKAVLEAKTFGFDGASCVHPALIPLLNQGFSPTMQDIETARRLVEFYEQNVVDGKGAILFEGQMVDRPVVERARRILHSAS
jgi:citrate lyase subunit beta/citryl-CoA lyase